MAVLPSAGNEESLYRRYSAVRQRERQEEEEMQYFIFGMLTAGAVIVATELFLEYGF